MLGARRLKATLVNPLGAMGLGGQATLEDRVHLWGTDPVHPTATAYDNLAREVLRLASKQRPATEAAPKVTDRGTKGKAALHTLELDCRIRDRGTKIKLGSRNQQGRTGSLQGQN